MISSCFFRQRFCVYGLTQDNVWSNTRVDAKLQGFTRVKTESPKTGRTANWYKFGRKFWKGNFGIILNKQRFYPGKSGNSLRK